jgi:tetratricopeptide (TPR) repeat protein
MKNSTGEHKMRKIRRLLLCAAAITTAAFWLGSFAYSSDIPGLYKDAMDAFYKKDYKAAIVLWQKVMELDPAQKCPARLIEMARVKILENSKQAEADLQATLDNGEYAAALEKIGVLLEADPTNPNWLAMKTKLEKFTAAVAPSITAPGKIAALLRKSVNGYLGREKDERVAVLASRYAWQIDKNDKTAEKTFIFMDKEYSVIARLETMDRMKNVVEQKLDTVLEAIYDGRYELASMECELVLTLEPENTLAWKRIGSIYYAQGKLKQARTAWQTALKYSPNDDELKKFLQKTK